MHKYDIVYTFPYVWNVICYITEVAMAFEEILQIDMDRIPKTSYKVQLEAMS